MTKNIEVVDEFGFSYGVTYPKRAKGLVKNGRARFENDEKIILTRPPEHLIMEDNTMSDNKQKTLKNTDDIIVNTANAAPDPGALLDAPTAGLELPSAPQFTPTADTPPIVSAPQPPVGAALAPPADEPTPLAPVGHDESFGAPLSPEQALEAYETFVQGLQALGPTLGSTDTRPEQARIALEKLLRSEDKSAQASADAVPDKTWQDDLRLAIIKFTEYAVGNQPNGALPWQTNLELLLNPNNPLHNELSEAMREWWLWDGAAKDKTRLLYQITDAAKRVIHEHAEA